MFAIQEVNASKSTYSIGGMVVKDVHSIPSRAPFSLECDATLHFVDIKVHQSYTPSAQCPRILSDILTTVLDSYTLSHTSEQLHVLHRVIFSMLITQ